MSDTEPSRREVPAWVFVIVILLCLGGGVGFVYWYFAGGSPVGREITLKAGQENAVNQPRPQGNRGNANRNNVRRQPTPLQMVSAPDDKREYRLRGRSLMLDVVDNRNQPDVFNFRSSGRGLLDADQLEIARLRWRVLNDQPVAKYLNLADWQLAKLRAMDTNNAVIADDDRAKVAALWDSQDVWNKPIPPDSQQMLIALLDQIGERSAEATKAKWTANIEAVKSIITPEQLEAMKKMGTPEAKTPPMPPPPAK